MAASAADAFDHVSRRAWMTSNWTLCFWFSAAYMLFLLAARKCMLAHPGFRLQGVLAAWNLALAVFSTAGACHQLAEAATILHRHGFDHSVCDPSVYTGTSGFWVWLFVLSKLPELGDTVFLVLRKRSVPFLHWYHHVTVLCYTWYSYVGFTAPGRWFIAMNYTVHAIMYSYYALRALRVPVPALVGMAITTLQMTQMAVGCIINARAYRLKGRGEPCHVTDTNIAVSMIMYTSYFVLFAQFFYNAYLKKGGRQKQE